MAGDRVAALVKGYKGWWAGRIVSPRIPLPPRGYVRVMWDGSNTFSDVKNSRFFIVKYADAAAKGFTINVDET